MRKGSIDMTLIKSSTHIVNTTSIGGVINLKPEEEEIHQRDKTYDEIIFRRRGSYQHKDKI
jgi:hypothetical protein